MRTRLAHTASLAVLLYVLAGAAPARGSQRAEPAPRLVVIVSIDGLSWARLDHYRPWYVAGLKRLLDESTAFTEARYRHLNTETAPGHSSLSTGAPPRVTGIVANAWIELRDGRMRHVGCIEQDAADGSGIVLGAGHLRVPTLGDRLVEAHPKARVVTLSAKDRSAILLAGRDRRHAPYWFDQNDGRFVTSPAYEPPAAVRNRVALVNRRLGPMLPARFGLAWPKLAAAEPAAPKPLPTPVPGLYDYQLPTLGLGWPHDLGVHPRGYFTALYYSPFVDEILADVAVALIEDGALGLGRGAAPDLLGLSFSGQDSVSHSYGNESEENLDALRRLDIQLGRVLDALERRVPSGLVLAFSSDHGFPLIPEAARARDASLGGGRLVYQPRGLPTYLERLNRALADALCLPETPEKRAIYFSDGWNIVYNRPAFPQPSLAGACGPAGREVTTADVDRVLPGVVRTLFAEEVEAVYLVSQAASWPGSETTEFVRNDFDEERSGDAIFVPRRGAMMHWDPGRGAMHGTHHDYDTHVPLMFRGGPFRPGASAVAATPYDLAPTLAALLGLTLPDATGVSRVP